ncbi:MAG: hypothetical protein RL430_2135 [Actinomycetota bacterium]
MRAVMFVGSDTLSMRSLESGKSGVRSSKRGRCLALSGSLPLTVWISSIAGFFSLRPAGRDMPVTWSPFRSPYWRVSFTGMYASSRVGR